MTEDEMLVLNAYGAPRVRDRFSFCELCGEQHKRLGLRLCLKCEALPPLKKYKPSVYCDGCGGVLNRTGEPTRKEHCQCPRR